jgi:hypothetical protein
MEYNKIIAVTGLPGLYELLSSKSDGAIVRSLDDKTTRFVSSRVHNFSHLESIEVYTVRDNVNLVEILKAMESSTEKQPDDKDAAELKSYFSKVYPDLDFGRVYSSDLKKMVKWYAVLKANDIEIKLSEEEMEGETPVEEAEEVKVKAAPAPSKKAEKTAPAVKEAVKERDAKAVTAKKEAHTAEPVTKAKTEKAPARKTAQPAAKPKTEKAPVKKTAAAAKKKTDKKEAPAANKSKKAAKKKS